MVGKYRVEKLNKANKIVWQTTDIEEEIEAAHVSMLHFVQRRGADLSYLKSIDIVQFYWHVRKIEEDIQREIDSQKKSAKIKK